MQRKLPFALMALLFCVSSGFAVVRQHEGKWFDAKLIPSRTPDEHFEAAYRFLCKKQYDHALSNFRVILVHYAGSSYYAQSVFYMGVCHYFLSDFKEANEKFSTYLLLDDANEFFEKIFEFKFHMAEHYRTGMRKHLLGLKLLPRWMPTKEQALDLYEEVIIALPSSELATQSLFGKAQVLKLEKRYEESTETLQTLCRRFPAHPLAAEGYLLISSIYHEQCKKDAQNPDLLGLAMVNRSYFEKSFPHDERVSIVDGLIQEMQEMLASALYDTGRFYERKSKPHASAIYYRETLRKYPNTDAAGKCQDRIEHIGSVS